MWPAKSVTKVYELKDSTQMKSSDVLRPSVFPCQPQIGVVELHENALSASSIVVKGCAVDVAGVAFLIPRATGGALKQSFDIVNELVAIHAIQQLLAMSGHTFLKEYKGFQAG